MTIVIHLTGTPGSGKGTQSELLIERMGFTHFSVGQLMRDEIALGTELGKQLSIINEGKIAPPEVTMQVIKKHVTDPRHSRIVLDGFPRTVEQAELYNKIVGPANLTIIFDLPEEECMKRLRIRALTSDRKDDTEEMMKVRFDQYYSKTAPAIEYSQKNTKCATLECRGTIEQVWERMQALVKPLLTK